MSIKQKLHRYFWILSIALLVSCSAQGPQPSVSNPTLAPNATPAAQAATALPTETPFVPSPTATQPSSISLGGLRLVYLLKGNDNLYIQDGSNPPIQLTKSGENSAPVMSEDGEKIVFLHGAKSKDLYSINPDGSDERVLMTHSQLLSKSSKYEASTAFCNMSFVPHAHSVLFSTCSSVRIADGQGSKPNSDLFIADIDANKIKNLFAPGRGGDYQVSPDGTMLAIDFGGHIDILGLNGKPIRRYLITYTESQPWVLAPFIFWTEDSKELIVLIPNVTHYEPGYLASFTTWRYSIASGAGTQIYQNPRLTGSDMAQVSPDGNWMLYRDDEHGVFYLGDLVMGSSLLISHPDTPSSFGWSPDNRSYFYAINGIYMGLVRDQTTFIDAGHDCSLIGWIDERHFLYVVNNGSENTRIEIGATYGDTRVVLSGNIDVRYEFTYTYQNH